MPAADSFVDLLVHKTELDHATAAALVARLGGSTVSATADYSAVAGDTVLASKAAGMLVHLPVPTANARVTVKNVGASGTVTVDTPGAETIDGANTVALATQFSKTTVVSDGTNWFVVA